MRSVAVKLLHKFVQMMDDCSDFPDTSNDREALLTLKQQAIRCLDGVEEAVTPQDWWQFAPWNNDLSSADRGKRIILKCKGKIIFGAFYGFNGWEFGGVAYNDADGWMQLPEQGA